MFFSSTFKKKIIGANLISCVLVISLFCRLLVTQHLPRVAGGGTGEPQAKVYSWQFDECVAGKPEAT